MKVIVGLLLVIHDEASHLLSALLSRERPDPAAELLHALNVDQAETRSRLAECGK
jgi:hypothetical protein